MMLEIHVPWIQSLILNVCVFINFFITVMCFSFLLEYDQAKSNESFETEKAVSYLMVNIQIENISFIKTNGTWREPPAIELITQIKVTAKATK